MSFDGVVATQNITSRFRSNAFYFLMPSEGASLVNTLAAGELVLQLMVTWEGRTASVPLWSALTGSVYHDFHTF